MSRHRQRLVKRIRVWHLGLGVILMSGLAAFFPTAAQAGGNGGFAGAFLRMGLGARAQALGDAQVASPEGGYGSFYNPAGLSLLKHATASLSYSSLALDRRFYYLGVALPLRGFAGLSAGWIYSGVGNLRSYNSIGQDTGGIDHGLHAVYFSFGLSLIGVAQQSAQLKGLPADLLSVGISVKFLRETLNDRADFNYKGTGVGVDLGVLAHPVPFLWLGYQLKDVGSQLKSNTNTIFERGTSLDNQFPISQRVGAKLATPWRGLAALYDFEWSDAGARDHHLGAEWQGPGVDLRLGYDDNRLTAGLGFDFRALHKLNLVLDYAFVDDAFGEGATHVFSWQFLF